MNWKGIFPAIWRAIKPAAPALIQAATTAAGVPMVGTFLNAALYAQDRADSGPERFTAGLAALQVDHDALQPPSRLRRAKPREITVPEVQMTGVNPRPAR